MDTLLHALVIATVWDMEVCCQTQGDVDRSWRQAYLACIAFSKHDSGLPEILALVTIAGSDLKMMTLKWETMVASLAVDNVGISRPLGRLAKSECHHDDGARGICRP